MDEELKEYIPENAISKGLFLGIYYQNWIECILTTGCIALILFSSPLVMKIKIICMLVLGISNILFFLRGIQNKSVFHFFKNVLETNHTKAEYHLGSIDNERKSISENQFGRQSILEKGIKNFKKRFYEFDQKYGN